MPKTRELLHYSPEQVQDFLNSFDIVLSDCDGVLWHFVSPIDGALDSLKKLQAMGKRVYLVTNNSTVSVNQYCQRIQKYGLDVKPEQVINTSTVITWYLKKINFRGKAFVISSSAFRKALTDAGVDLVDRNVRVSELDIASTLKTVQEGAAVEAVITDVDIFCDWAKMGYAISCLQRNEDILYLCGAQDEWAVYDQNKRVLGPGPVVDVITRQSGKTPINYGKPSEVLKEYIFQNCDVQDPSRCLFVGDTRNQDMKFGTLCGFQKLFVSTGCDTLEEAQQHEDTYPDFYIPSLGQLNPLIHSIQKNSVNSKST